MCAVAILFLVDGCRFIAIDYCAASGGMRLAAQLALQFNILIDCVICGWLVSYLLAGGVLVLHDVSWQISTALIKHCGVFEKFKTKGSMSKEQEMKFIPALISFNNPARTPGDGVRGFNIEPQQLLIKRRSGCFAVGRGRHTCGMLGVGGISSPI